MNLLGRECRYLPVIDLRPAEMLALEQLPRKDKEMMLPLFQLRPWVASKNLELSIARLQSAFGNSRAFLKIADSIPVMSRREVHGELDRLRSHENGYANWVRFFEQESNLHFVPCIQLESPEGVEVQTGRLLGLGRGALVHIVRNALPYVDAILSVIRRASRSGRGLVVLLDYEKETGAIVSQVGPVAALLSKVKNLLPEAEVSFSASSFPDSFVEISTQPIYERLAYQEILKRLDFPIIFSDRGGARAEKQQGGGGQPAPRIDFARSVDWHFFRDVDEAADREVAYTRQARRLMSSSIWDPRLKLWGTQMIERTALGDSHGITSPNRCTAVRVNIHLHQQVWYGDASELYDTDEDWTE